MHGVLPGTAAKMFIHTRRTSAWNRQRICLPRLYVHHAISKHVQKIIVKANSRCGVLATRLPIGDLSLDLVIRIYNCYVIPLFRFGLQLWLSSCSAAVLESVNSSFTKFLKRYLGVPYYCNNAITHYITKTIPLTSQLYNLLDSGLGAFRFPISLSGYQISFLGDPRHNEPYDPIEIIPSYFWRSRAYINLPTRFRNRKILMRELFDLDHEIYCTKDSFHFLDEHDCKCKICGQVMSYYHKYFCSM